MAEEMSFRLNVVKGDDSGIDLASDAARELANAEKNTASFSQELQGLTKDFDRAKKSAESQLNATKRGLAQAESAAVEFEATLQDIEKAAKEVAVAVENIPEKRTIRIEPDQDVSRTFKDSTGDISTTFGALGSVGGGLGASGLAEGSQFLGDAFGLIEYQRAFRTGLNELGTVLQNTDGIIGGLANTGAQVASVIPGVSAGFGAVLAVAAPLAIGAGALALAFNQTQSAIDATNAAARAFFAERAETRDIQTSGITTEDAQAELNRLRLEEASLLRDTIDGETIRNQTFEETRNQISGSLGPLSFLGDAVTRGAFAVADARGQFNSFNEGIQTANTELENTRARIAALEQGLKDGTIASNDSKEANEARIQVLEQEESALIAKRDQAAAAINALIEQEANLIASYQERQRVTAEDRALTDARSEEDDTTREERQAEDLASTLEANEEQHQQRLIDITNQGKERILDLRQELVEREADAQHRILDLQADFAQQRAKKDADFARDSQRRFEDYTRRRNAIEQDAQASILDSLINNDVIGLQNAQRERDQALTEVDSEFQTDEQRQNQDFAAQRAEEEAALAAKIQDIQTEVAEFRNAQQVKITEELAAIETRKKAEIQAYEEGLAADSARRALIEQREEEDQARRLARLDEDRRIQDERAQNALDKSLDNIDTRRTAEQAYYDDTLSAIKLLTIEAKNFATAVEEIPKYDDPSISTSGGFGGGNVTPYGFNSNTGMLPSNNYPNLPPIPQSSALPSNVRSIPASPTLPNTANMRGVDGGMSAPTNIFNITVDATVGDVASLSQVDAVATRIAEQIGDKVQMTLHRGNIKGIAMSRKVSGGVS